LCTVLAYYVAAAEKVVAIKLQPDVAAGKVSLLEGMYVCGIVQKMLGALMCRVIFQKTVALQKLGGCDSIQKTLQWWCHLGLFLVATNKAARNSHFKRKQHSTNIYF